MKSIPIKIPILLLHIIFTICWAEVYADIEIPAQIVQLTTDDKLYFKSGEEFVVFARYNVSDDSKVTGLGIKIHYNSKLLTLNISDDDYYYQDGYQGSVQNDDIDNSDDDPLTNRVIIMAWSSLGGNSWPWKKLPIDLIQLNFKVQNEISATQTYINVTKTSSAGGYSFEGNNLQLFINPTPNPDINNDGILNFIDVLTILNHLGKVN